MEDQWNEDFVPIIGSWFLIFPAHGPMSWTTSFAGWMVKDNRWQSHKCHPGCANGLGWTFAERSSLALISKCCKERPAGESWIENWFFLAWIFLYLRRWVQFHGTLSGVVRHFNSRDFATALRGLGELLAETARSTQARSCRNQRAIWSEVIDRWLSAVLQQWCQPWRWQPNAAITCSCLYLPPGGKRQGYPRNEPTRGVFPDERAYVIWTIMQTRKTFVDSIALYNSFICVSDNGWMPSLWAQTTEVDRFRQLSAIFGSYDYQMKGEEYIDQSPWPINWKQNMEGILRCSSPTLPPCSAFRAPKKQQLRFYVVSKAARATTGTLAGSTCSKCCGAVSYSPGGLPTNRHWSLARLRFPCSFHLLSMSGKISCVSEFSPLAQGHSVWLWSDTDTPGAAFETEQILAASET